MSEQENRCPNEVCYCTGACMGMSQDGKHWSSARGITRPQPAIEGDAVEREISFTCEQTGRRYIFPNTAKLIEAFLIANTRHGDSHIAPTIDEELVERVARTIYAVSPAHFSGTTVEVPWDEVAPPYKECAIREARAALAAMQPAIDKAVAEERARCVGVCQNYEGSENQKIAGTARAIRQSIEQGGGDAD